MNTSNDATEFFSEYCDEDNSRYGIAFSRMCQTMAEAIKEFKDNAYYAKILQKENTQKPNEKPTLYYRVVNS